MQSRLRNILIFGLFVGLAIGIVITVGVLSIFSRNAAQSSADDQAQLHAIQAQIADLQTHVKETTNAQSSEVVSAMGTANAASTEMAHVAQTASAIPNQLLRPVDTPVLQSTNIPKPINTSISTLTPVPTDTPIPSATPIPDTPAGTVLDIGQSWRQGGVELVLKEENVTTSPNMGIVFKIYLTNKKPQAITVRHSAEQNYRAVDNRGRILKMVDRYTYYLEILECANITQIINPDQTVLLSCNRENGYGGGTEHTFVPVDIGKNEITEITVTVLNISDITEARWRIPIYH